jgi:UDPglucose 6-dehydrogenase
MVKKIREALGGSEAGKTIAILGLTFKPETDDMRDAPSLAIIPNLVDKGAMIRAHDPQGVEEALNVLPDQVKYFDDVYETVTDADAVVLLTEWNEYRGLDFDRVNKKMKSAIFVDLRNVYEPEVMGSKGFVYISVGR